MRGEGAFDIEYRIFGKDGDVRWIRARGRASFDANGKPVRKSGTNMDINDIIRPEASVVQAKVAEEKANQAKSEKLSSRRHELRTPTHATLGKDNNLEY